MQDIEIFYFVNAPARFFFTGAHFIVAISLISNASRRLETVRLADSLYLCERWLLSIIVQEIQHCAQSEILFSAPRYHVCLPG